MLHHIVTHETSGAHGMQNVIHFIIHLFICSLALTLHNVIFQAQVMGQAREAIITGTFPEYLRSFFARYFGESGYPEWCVNALRSVGVDLLEGNPHGKVISGSGVRWDYAL
jgi:queuine tRNA-ribosyltransferase